MPEPSNRFRKQERGTLNALAPKPGGAIIFEWIIGLGVVGIVLVIVAPIFWIWGINDCLQNPRLQVVEKVAWLLVILFGCDYLFRGQAAAGDGIAGAVATGLLTKETTG